MTTVKAEDIELVSVALQSQDSDGIHYWINRSTGELDVQDNDSTLLEEDDEPNPDFLIVPNLGSREAYKDMERFTETVEDEELRSELYEALSKGKPFAEFKSVLLNHKAEQSRWFQFEEEARLERAKAWLQAEGFEV